MGDGDAQEQRDWIKNLQLMDGLLERWAKRREYSAEELQKVGCRCGPAEVKEDEGISSGGGIMAVMGTIICRGWDFRTSR